MYLVKFTEPCGDPIYVNPKMVRYVCKDDCNEGQSVISFTGATAYVKGEPEEIVHRLENAGNVFLRTEG